MCPSLPPPSPLPAQLLPATAFAIRCVHANNDIFHASANFAPGPHFQTRRALQLQRFFDGQTFYKAAEVATLLRGLQHEDVLARRIFFEAMSTTRRRTDSSDWAERPIAVVLQLASEFHLLCRKVRAPCSRPGPPSKRPCHSTPSPSVMCANTPPHGAPRPWDAPLGRLRGGPLMAGGGGGGGTSSIRQLLGAADTQTAHHATFSTVQRRQLLGSANAETTPARAPAAAADRKQRPDATCEGKNG